MKSCSNWENSARGSRSKPSGRGFQEVGQSRFAAAVDQRQVGAHEAKEGVQFHCQLGARFGKRRRGAGAIPRFQMRQRLRASSDSSPCSTSRRCSPSRTISRRAGLTASKWIAALPPA